jgi:hypothetical protein
MKKVALCLLMAVVLTSCADSKVIDGKEYRPYGVLNEGSVKCDSIYYEVSGWALFSGIVFFECIAPPIYVFGYNFWEPKMSIRQRNELKGIKNP